MHFIDSTFSQVSGFTNIFKQESNTLIPLVRNKFDSKAKLSRANVGAIESLNDSEMDAEEAIQTTEFDKGENAEHKILGYDGNIYFINEIILDMMVTSRLNHSLKYLLKF